MDGWYTYDSEIQKTTPDQARAILSSQPAIAYGLINIMIKMNAVNVDVLQVSFYSPIFLGRMQFENNIVSSSKL